jgi:phosphatidylglycerol lysyltransferase
MLVNREATPPNIALERSRSLVRRYGRAATCWQVLHPALSHWFSAAGDGVVGFVTYRGVRVAAGEPVCPPARLTAVHREFTQDAAGVGEQVCYLAAEHPMIQRLRRAGDHAVVPIGAQPVWHPATLEDIIQRDAALRYQLNRARNKNLRIGEWPAGQSRHPGLQRCLTDWLQTKPLPPLGFMTDPYLLQRMDGRRLWVAEQNGRVAGYTLLSPVPARNGWLVEQIVRGRGAPNGTAESLVAAAAHAVTADGSEFFTLGAAPLSRRGPRLTARHPLWLRAITGWMRAHGTRFYNFRGLEHFKAKFKPRTWEPVFAVATEPRIRPATLYAVMGAFTGRSPLGAACQAVASGLGTEIQRLRRNISRSHSVN